MRAELVSLPGPTLRLHSLSRRSAGLEPNHARPSACILRVTGAHASSRLVRSRQQQLPYLLVGWGGGKVFMADVHTMCCCKVGER